MVVALVAVPGLLYSVPALAGADAAFVVLSGSMVPAFAAGDVVFVERVPASEIAVGDVVTFRVAPGSDTLVTHRVIEVREQGGFRTQGDANEEPDPFVVRSSEIVGRYSFHIPWWGLLVEALRTKVGYALLVLVPGTLVIGTELVSLYRALDRWDRSRSRGRDS